MTEVNQGTRSKGIRLLTVVAVPTIQYQKYDQPNSRAMPVGTVYTRGLIVFSSLIDAMCIPISWAYLFP
jgi:hypothetical protein